MNLMIPFVWQWMAIYGPIVASASIPTSSQKVLGGLDEAHIYGQGGFSVGFDLTPSYGTAAVSFPNGTTVTLAKVPADDDYIEMLQRLRLDSSRHPSPPYNNIGETWDDIPRQWLRKARKAIGLAPSPDISRLAKMICNLRARVESQTGIPFDSATVTTLHLPALYYEDLHDAFEYVGLTYIPYHFIDTRVLYEISAAFAGYGNGLCSNYTDQDACRREQDDMPMEVDMAVLFTRNVLTVSLSVTKSAYYLYDTSSLVDFTLGYDSRGREGANEEKYWDAVGSKLEQSVIDHHTWNRPAKVLLMGDCVGDETFRRVLARSLSHQMADMAEILSADAEGVAAKGAAEFAKRFPYG